MDAFATAVGLFPYDVELGKQEIKALYPDLWDILQKTDVFFESPRILFHQSLNAMDRTIVWTHLGPCVLQQFLQEDIHDNIQLLLSIVKKVIPFQEDDEVSRILNDETSQSSLQDFLEFCLTTKTITTLVSISKQIPLNDLLQHPDLIQILRNPDHPILQSLIHKVQTLFKDILRRGVLTQRQIEQDVETIKSKLTSIFGSLVSGMLGSETNKTPSSILLSNSPDARNQRIRARLQKKYRAKH